MLGLQTPTCPALGARARRNPPAIKGRATLSRDVDYSEVIEKSTAYISENLQLNITLERLAQEAGCNPFQVIRAFRRVTGMTPHVFLIQARIRRAIELLREGQPAAEIASEVGFFDQSHFIRHFKRRTGCTPGRYLSSQESCAG